jgi:hypothetical protein
MSAINLFIHSLIHLLLHNFQDIIRNDKFETTTRCQASLIRYPSIVAPGPITLLTNTPEQITDVSTLQRILSKSTCEEMVQNLRGPYSAVSSKLGTFDKTSLTLLIRIHRLRDVAQRVKMEQNWLRKTITPPNETCVYREHIMSSFENLIMNTPDRRYVFDYNRSIMSSDLAILAGTTWLNYSILSGIVKLLQTDTTSVFMLNDLLGMSTKSRRKIIRNCPKSTRCVTFIVNVGKSGIFWNPTETGLSLDIAIHRFNHQQVVLL